MATNQEHGVRDTFLRTIAVVGLVAVLLLGAWGIIQLAVALPSLFGSIGSNTTGSTTKETLTASAPATLASGQSLTVSWNHQNKDGDYSYSLSYACANGLSLKAPLPTGAYQSVPCNTPFNFTNASSKMTLIPSLTGNTSATLALSISATKLSTGAITTSGSANTTITPAQNTASNTSGSQTTTHTSSSAGSTSSYYPAPTRPALYGYGDLVVYILSVTPSGNLTNVQFEIVNAGTNMVRSGWSFNANLPINGGYTFASQPQQALYPGDKIVYTMSYANSYSQQYPYNNGYTNYNYNGGWGYPINTNTCNMYGPCAIPGYNNGYTNYNYSNGYSYGYNGTITITADPYNQVVESNKANNTASIQAPNW